MHPITIQVDDRESRGAVAGLLKQSPDFCVTATRLPLGDYRVDGRFLFERKTLTDLVAAIKDGRLFRQALKLSASTLQPAIILEGTGRELAGSAMRWEAIQGALVTVALFCRVPLLRPCTPEETVRTMLFAARQGRTFASGALPRRGRRPHGKLARQLFILQGLPGIGAERAHQLLARFGSVEAITRAGAEDLCSVPGIGARIAGVLRWSVEEPRCNYRLVGLGYSRPTTSASRRSDVQSDFNPAFVAAAASDPSCVASFTDSRMASSRYEAS